MKDIIYLSGYFVTVNSPEFENEYKANKIDNSKIELFGVYDSMYIKSDQWSVDEIYEGSPIEPGLYQITPTKKYKEYLERRDELEQSYCENDSIHLN